jgi:hypothetical protein
MTTDCFKNYFYTSFCWKIIITKTGENPIFARAAGIYGDAIYG